MAGTFIILYVGMQSSLFIVYLALCAIVLISAYFYYQQKMRNDDEDDNFNLGALVE